MSTQATTYRYLAPKPDSAYRQLFVKGGRVRADVIYGLYVNAEEASTPQQIAQDYGLPLEAVEEAIAYCASDPAEVRQDHERESRLSEAMGTNDPGYKYHPSPKLLSAQEWARLKR